jgi:hypothetical protein
MHLHSLQRGIPSTRSRDLCYTKALLFDQTIHLCIAGKMTSLLFMAVDDTGRMKMSDIRLIRSYVMREKNKKAGSRRSLRQARQASKMSCSKAHAVKTATSDREVSKSSNVRKIAPTPDPATTAMVHPSVFEVPLRLLDEFYGYRKACRYYAPFLVTHTISNML